MKTIFLFVGLIFCWCIVNAQQMANRIVISQNEKEAVTALDTTDYWIGENEHPWQNEDYRFGADPGKVKTFKIYPNPSPGIIHIDGLPETNHELWILQLADMSGRLIYSVKLDPTEASINLPEVSRGNYVIKLMYNNFFYTSRITLF